MKPADATADNKLEPVDAFCVTRHLSRKMLDWFHENLKQSPIPVDDWSLPQEDEVLSTHVKWRPMPRDFRRPITHIVELLEMIPGCPAASARDVTPRLEFAKELFGSLPYLEGLGDGLWDSICHSDYADELNIRLYRLGWRDGSRIGTWSRRNAAADDLEQQWQLHNAVRNRIAQDFLTAKDAA